MLNYNKKEIKCWEEAIPLGNGNIGGLLFGGKDGIRLNIDSSSLWDTRPVEKFNRDDFTFDEILRLYRGGEEMHDELNARFLSPEGVYPTKIPCGAVIFVPESGEECEFYFSMAEAVGGVKLSSADKIECFFSATNFLGYARFPESVKIEFLPPDYRCNNVGAAGPDSNSLGLLGYPEGKVVLSDDSIVYRQPTAEGDYSVLAVMKKNGGAREMVFAVRTCSDGRGDSEVFADIKEALDKGYDAALAEHKAWWNDYNSKVSVDLPKKYSELEELYRFSHYLLGSGSRESFAPMALQGVWTAANDALPPWRGDYHFDLNVQGTYNWVYRAGRAEMARPLIEYFKRNKENMIEFSRRFFGEDGVFFVPGTADLNGNTVGGWVQYTYSLTSSMWMLLVLDKWCDYTHDKAFLEEFIIPAFNGSYKLMMDKFVCTRDGKYELVISASPEINDNKYSAWVKNSTYDISITKEFLRVYIKRLREIGSPTADAKDTLARFIPEHVGEDGYILAENMPLEVSHRHFAHCMNIFPFQTLDPRSGEDAILMQKTISNLEKCGTSLWTGFSFVWMSALYATAGDGEGALKYLEIFCDGFVSDNGFHLNGDFKKRGYSNFTYRPFTVEANGMYAEAIGEMLMQYHHEVLRLFPAIPKEWGCGCSFRGFAIDANTHISASVCDGVIECEITVDTERALQIEAFGVVHTVKLCAGKNSFRFAGKSAGV